jgi:hypothetical protein
MRLQHGAAPFLQGNIMEFTLTIDFGFGEKVEFNTTEFWKTVAMASFVERMEGIDEEVAEDEVEDEEEYVYDDEGYAYWYDEENDVWYMYDADEDDWVEVEVEDEAEDEAEEEEVAA